MTAAISDFEVAHTFVRGMGANLLPVKEDKSTEKQTFSLHGHESTVNEPNNVAVVTHKVRNIFCWGVNKIPDH